VVAKTERIKNHLEVLAQFNAIPGVGMTRLAFIPEERRARDYLKQELEPVGLAVYTDAAGNMFGRREGTDSAAVPALIGSHMISVRQGGAFDGAAGVDYPGTY
jgi:allantoate deiminase